MKNEVEDLLVYEARTILKRCKRKNNQKHYKIYGNIVSLYDREDGVGYDVRFTNESTFALFHKKSQKFIVAGERNWKLQDLLDAEFHEIPTF